MRVKLPVLEITAAIRKNQIVPFGESAGVINEKPFRGYEAKALRYRGFAGALNLETKLYTGVHVFDANTGEGTDADFTKLFGGK